jgi:hypothetical protein
MATRIEITRRRFGALFGSMLAMFGLPRRAEATKKKIVWIGHA